MTEPTPLVIAGAGGLGREILATVRACNELRPAWNVLGFLDPNPQLAGARIGGVPILGSDDWCGNNDCASLRFVCALGNAKARRQLVERLAAMNCAFASIVHPEVSIPDSVQVGAGCAIMAGTRFTVDAIVGSHVIIYLNCAITHDVHMHDFCTIAPGCNLAGASVLETGVELGTGVNVLPGRRVGAWTVIGAGSTVTSDIPPNSTALGTPCRVISTAKE